MGKLHEILAVEGDLKATATRVMNEIRSLFGNTDRFTGRIRRYRPLQEGGEQLSDQRSEVSTTVQQELDRFISDMGKWVDAAVQKEQSNTLTKADVVVDGTVLLADLCAPALLNLEGKLAEIRKVYSAIPTNDLAERWRWDGEMGTFVSDPRITYSTKKTMHSFEASPATKEHPAQVSVYTEDEKVGAWETTLFSGAISPVEKQVRLERVDTLLRAVKQARQRANNVEASKVKVANTLFLFINGG
jgi:hypothetical protein